MMRPLLLAVQFLTALPLRTDEAQQQDTSRSYFYYPVVGAIIGGGGAAVYYLSSWLFPHSFSVVLTMGFLVCVTGGLHQDGLADILDGMGGWSRDERLRIMKDSRIGSFGTLGIVLAMLAKYAALTSMPAETLLLALVVGCTMSRWIFLPMGYFNPPAQAGLGSAFLKNMTLPAVITGTIFALGLSLAMLGMRAIVVAAAAIIAVVGVSVYFRNRLGGVTGDCFGATAELVEIVSYAMVLYFL
jgi:adenosylcobinamide-GDP ribazoletransferase